MPAEKTITITWRDENYGRIHDAQAFRYEKDPFPSQTETQNIARIIKRNGFEANLQRASWIAEYKSEDVCLALTEAFEAAGYVVKHAGAVPNIFASTSHRI